MIKRIEGFSCGGSIEIRDREVCREFTMEIVANGISYVTLTIPQARKLADDLHWMINYCTRQSQEMELAHQAAREICGENPNDYLQS